MHYPAAPPGVGAGAGIIEGVRSPQEIQAREAPETADGRGV